MQFRKISDLIGRGQYDDAFSIIESLDNEITQSKQIVTNTDVYIQTDKNQNYHISVLFNVGGFLIDIGSLSSDTNILERGIELTEKLQRLEKIESYDYYPSLLYNLANGLSAKVILNQGPGQKAFLEDIELSERVKSIYRKAIQQDQNNPEILVNYANLLRGQIGRGYESLEFYDQALALDSDQAMALANKAETLLFLLRFVGGDAAKAIIVDSYFMLRRSVEIGLESGPLKYFGRLLDNLEKSYPQLLTVKNRECDGRIGEPENTYKGFYLRLCHKERLFLNALGKEHQCSAALYDPLTISKMIVNMDDEKKYHRFSGYLNRLKQEYVMSRHLAVQSFHKDEKLKFVDEGVNLVDTLDYLSYSIFLEHARSAYRVAYGILDKIAYVVNEYYQFGFANERLHFHNLSMWKYCLDKPNKKICDKLKRLQPFRNPFLGAIMDLANDFENNHFTGLKKTRHLLEHRFFEIYTEHSFDKVGPSEFRDTLLNLLRLIKAAIFYLVMMIDWKEAQKEAEIDPNSVITMRGLLIPDDWKKD